MNEEQFDNKIFNLSQNASNNSSMPFNEEAWLRMEELLDGEKGKKRRFIIWWWLLPLLLVGGIASIYWHSSHSSTAKTDIDKQVQITLNAASGVTISKTKPGPIIDVNDTKNTDVILTQSNRLTNNTIANSNTVEVATNKTKHNNFANKVQLDIKKTIPNANASTHDLKVSNQSISGNKNQIQQPQIGLNLLDGDTKNATNNSSIIADTSKEKIVLSTNLQTGKTVDTASVSSVKIVIADSINATKKEATKPIIKLKKSILSRFEMSAFVSGDVSSVNFKNTDRKSVAYGVGLSYQFSKKLSIATGFGISRKLYIADSSDYKNPPTVSINYKLQNIDANCLVFEVPLNIQYQFKQSNKNSWVAIAGFSTYFMKNESYDYNYLWYSQTRKTNYVIENKNNQLFSILNLSVGYRKQLSNKLSYQISPFVKIPLTGIGEGKVALYSAGLQLSINLKGK